MRRRKLQGLRAVRPAEVEGGSVTALVRACVRIGCPHGHAIITAPPAADALAALVFGVCKFRFRHSMENTRFLDWSGVETAKLLGCQPQRLRNLVFVSSFNRGDNCAVVVTNAGFGSVSAFKFLFGNRFTGYLARSMAARQPSRFVGPARLSSRDAGSVWEP